MTMLELPWDFQVWVVDKLHTALSYISIIYRWNTEATSKAQNRSWV